MKRRERIPKEIVEKYEETIEPRTMWILPIGYEIDATALDVFSQHMLSQSVDEKEGRFNTFKEKNLELH